MARTGHNRNAGRKAGAKQRLDRKTIQELVPTCTLLLQQLLEDAVADNATFQQKRDTFKIIAPYLIETIDATRNRDAGVEQTRKLMEALSAAMVSNPAEGVGAPAAGPVQDVNSPVQHGPCGAEELQDGDRQAETGAEGL